MCLAGGEGPLLASPDAYGVQWVMSVPQWYLSLSNLNLNMTISVRRFVLAKASGKGCTVAELEPAPLTLRTRETGCRSERLLLAGK